MSIRPKWTPPVPDGEPLPYTQTEIEKSGVLSPSFGSRTKRRNQLVQRLKRRRMYGPPVKGGTKGKRGRLGGSLSGRKHKRR